MNEISAPREVMDVHDAAKYLGISHDTLYGYAASGFVPGFKLGNRWRFRRVRLDEWMDEEALSTGMLARVQGKKTGEL